MRPTDELLYDSEASLRLVDRAIGDLGTSRAENADGYADTAAIVVRFCQGAGLLDAGRIEALQHMPWRLGNYSSGGESTTSEVMDALRRALALVDALDETDGLTDDTRRITSTSLRNELAAISDLLKTHQATSPQMADIATLVTELRLRIDQLATPQPSRLDRRQAISA